MTFKPLVGVQWFCKVPEQWELNTQQCDLSFSTWKRGAADSAAVLLSCANVAHRFPLMRPDWETYFIEARGKGFPAKKDTPQLYTKRLRDL